MPFCLIVATNPTDQMLPTLSNQAESALVDLYPNQQVHRTDWGWCGVLSAQASSDRRKGWVLDEPGGHGLLSAGSWFFGDALASGKEPDLLNQIKQAGFETVLDAMNGVFCLASIDNGSRQVDIGVDTAGSYHVYRAEHKGLLLVSDSALVLSALTQAKLNPEAVQQFIATAVIYGGLSLWQGLAKLPPASHLTIKGFDGEISQKTYWHCNRIKPEKYGLDESADIIAQALTGTAKAISGHFPNVLSDLTGGYDSRALILGFLLAETPVSTTVSGAETSPDAQVAQAIADHFGLPHRRVDRKEPANHQELADALVLTDGEFNVFEYARIAATHRGHVAAGHDLSVNGSFGELARAYWWELLLPKIGATTPIDPRMLARKRFAAQAYDRSIFSQQVAGIDLVDSLTQLIRLYQQEMAGFPNTTQMDYLYFVMRMQRWQGRIASGTNRIWPAVSPFAFRPILQPMLEAKASARLRNLLVRTLFARHLPELGRIPLEHGYPAMPASVKNILQFTPLIAHYGGRIGNKLLRKWRGSNLPAEKKPDAANLLADPEFLQIRKAEHLTASGLFMPERLLQVMQGEHQSEQWQRLVTLEMAMRRVGRIMAQFPSV